MSRDIGCQRLCGLKRLTITSKDIANLTLWNGDEWDTVNAVLERDEQVPATAQDIRLETGLGFQCDKPGFHRPPAAHQLLHNANTVVRNVAEEARHKDE